MNLSCTICSDLINPSDNIFVTKCGHLFHHHCLAQWIERSTTCPQCRTRVTQKDMFRIYPNLAEAGTDDAVTLQSKLDAINLQLREHKQIRTELEKKVTDHVADLNRTKELLKKTEDRLVSSECATGALREQLRMLKHVDRDNQQLKEDNKQLKKEQETCAAVQRVVNASMEEAEEMIAAYPDSKSIAIFASTLKRALTETELKWRTARADMSKLQSELTLLRTKYTKKKEKLVHLNQHYEELRKRKAEHDAQDHNKRRHLDETLQNDITENNVSVQNNMSVADNSECGLVRVVENASSPYLRLRTGGPAHTFKPTEMSTMKSLQSSNSQFSIFTNKRGGDCFSGGVSSLPLKGGPIGGLKQEARFDGLGGHSVPDVFPRSIPKIGVKHRLKRPAPSPTKQTPITQIFSRLK